MKSDDETSSSSLGSNESVHATRNASKIAKKSTTTPKELSAPLTRRLAALAISKQEKQQANRFLENFNPDSSVREKRKLDKRFNRKIAGQYYDHKGVHLTSGVDLCDCMEIACPGCFFACKRCTSTKCGVECRVNRKVKYEYIEYHGFNFQKRNPLEEYELENIIVIMENRKRKSTVSLESNTTQSKKSFWANGLIDSMKNPDLIIKQDDLAVIINDKYPKAKYHFLILSKQELKSLKHVEKSDLKLLEHMHQLAIDLISEEKFAGIKFKIGYHSEMSMIRLHLHVISDDMISDALKTKKHWNSFTTKFFLNSEDVIKELKDNNKIIFPSKKECEDFMVSSLKCHKCSYSSKTIPDLKRHILTHQ